MSIGMSQADETYADFDVHHITHKITAPNSRDDPTQVVKREEQFEITERGLEPDELAELVAFRVETSINVDHNAVPPAKPGSCVVEAGAGFNLSGQEFVQEGGELLATFDDDNSGTDDAQVRANDTDEVGQLWFSNYGTAITFEDEGSGTGGPAAASGRYPEVINLREMFGEGPVVDSVDDFTIRHRFELSSVDVYRVTSKLNFSLYYRVMETESGRSRFGR